MTNKYCPRCKSTNTLHEGNTGIKDNVFTFGCKDCGFVILNPTQEELVRLTSENLNLTDPLDIGIKINGWRNQDDIRRR